MDAPTRRTQVRRHPERGAYDPEVVDAILDEALICHLAYGADDGSPRVIPTIHTRIDDTLYLHGSSASRTMRATKAGLDVAVAATIVDGLVLARSAANHSMNYRSVVVYGTARGVTDPGELLAVARSIVEHVVPGRADHVRTPSDKEYRETTMLAVPLTEASAKIRTGPPDDAEADLASRAWAGVLPVSMTTGTPVPDGDPRDLPQHVTHYRRPGDAG
jgi:nitroimidazol reductase NimA-like FMN-containing flavoprotein (pyridoxamine 5'-phosphate oxidase superfamily)